jgi:RNA polymerase primary sigma factor
MKKTNGHHASLPDEDEADDSATRRRDMQDPLMLYFKDIGKVKLLTLADEVALAKRIKQGDDDAFKHMAAANTRLVVKIARRYEGFGLPLMELIAEGNVGLLTAVKKFRTDKGAKFSTYGSWWIRQSIKRALANQSRTIRLPVHMHDKSFRIDKAERWLYQMLDRNPTEEELADHIGMSVVRLKQIRGAFASTVSLDAPTSFDSDTGKHADYVPDERQALPDETLASKSNQEFVNQILAGLSPREADILRRRFGFNGSKAQTLDQVGKKYKVTRERIRQIQNIALKKLRKQMSKLAVTSP